MFPLITGLSVGVLAAVKQLASLICLRGQDRIPRASTSPSRVFILAAALFAYVFLLDKIGFPISTFVLIAFFLRVIESKSWIVTALIAIPTPFCTYLVFKVLLGVPIPAGFLGP